MKVGARIRVENRVRGCNCWAKPYGQGISIRIKYGFKFDLELGDTLSDTE